MWLFRCIISSVYIGFFIESETEEGEIIVIKNNYLIGQANIFFDSFYADEIQENLHKEIAVIKAFNWSINEIYSLPVGLRKFHMRQISKRLEEEKEALSKK